MNTYFQFDLEKASMKVKKVSITSISIISFTPAFLWNETLQSTITALKMFSILKFDKKSCIKSLYVLLLNADDSALNLKIELFDIIQQQEIFHFAHE